MGFMTEISFLNDDWHRIKEAIVKDPQGFVDEIDVLMNGRPQYRLVQDGNLAQPRREYLGSAQADYVHLPGMMYFEVHQSHHADDARLYLAWQNSFQEIDSWFFEREYGARLNNPNDYLIEVLEKQVAKAEQMVKEAKKFLREKRQALESR